MHSSTFHDLAANSRDTLSRLSLAFRDLMIEEAADASLPVALGEPNTSEGSAATLCSGLDSLRISTPQPDAIARHGATLNSLASSSVNVVPIYPDIERNCGLWTWETARCEVRPLNSEASPASDGSSPASSWDNGNVGTGAQGSAANHFASIPSFTQENWTTEPYFAPWATETGSTIPFLFDYTYATQGYTTGLERDSPYTTNIDYYDTRTNVGPMTGPTMLTPSYERGLARQEFRFDPAIRAGKRRYSDDNIVEKIYSQSTSSRSAKRARTEPLWMKWQLRRNAPAATAIAHPSNQYSAPIDGPVSSPSSGSISSEITPQPFIGFERPIVVDVPEVPVPPASSPRCFDADLQIISYEDPEVRAAIRKDRMAYYRQFKIENKRPEWKPRPIMTRWRLASRRRYSY